MNCWNGKMKRSSITLTYSSWRFKTVTSAPKALKSAIIAQSRFARLLSGAWGRPFGAVLVRRWAARPWFPLTSTGRCCWSWLPLPTLHRRPLVPPPCATWPPRRTRVKSLHRRLAPTPDGHQGEVGAHESNQHVEDYMVLLSDLRRGCRDEAGVETKVAGAPYE